MISASLAAIAVTGAGCASSPSTQQAIDGPMYPAGYADGCATAREGEKSFSTKVIQDESLFRDDASYRTGWRQGYSACSTNQNPVNSDNTGMDFEPF